MTDADRYLAEGKSVMFLTTCSYMLQNLIRTLRETGTPFHNPYRRRNGAWNPLQKRRGQTSTADRVLAFLGIQEKGMWSVEDLIHWTEMTKVKGVLQAKGRETVRNLTNGADGEVGWDGILTVLTEEAVEAGLQGDLDWFEANMTSTKKSAAKFPLAIARNRGAEQLARTPQANIGTVHSVKGAEADVVYLFPDVSRAGMAEWNGNSAQQGRGVPALLRGDDPGQGNPGAVRPGR